MASLSDGNISQGVIVSIDGDKETHRCLVDMGLVGASFAVKSKRKSGLLVDYGDFSAVTRIDVAKIINVRRRSV